VLNQADPAIARHLRNVFVIVDAEGLSGVSKFVSIANRRNQLRALIVRFDAGAAWLPHVLERAKLRTLRNILVHAGDGTPERVLNAWRFGAQRELIADARAFGDLLVVISCEPRTYEVPFDSIKALARLPRSRRGSFQVTDGGSHLHWPFADVHIDLEAIRCAVNPEARASSARMAALHNRVYGKAVAELPGTRIRPPDPHREQTAIVRRGFPSRARRTDSGFSPASSRCTSPRRRS
jgi:hypothetical protein